MLKTGIIVSQFMMRIARPACGIKKFPDVRTDSAVADFSFKAVWSWLSNVSFELGVRRA